MSKSRAMTIELITLHGVYRLADLDLALALAKALGGVIWTD